MKKIISLEFNELNFEFIDSFTKAGHLPHFRGAIERHGVVRTESERAQHLLEPWIQWPTVYSGKTFAEHGVFRLGDSLAASHAQVWELLEAHGLSVGAISPMNAANRCKSPAFFLPDAWTDTHGSADPRVLELHGCIRAMINGNASDDGSVIANIRKLLPLAIQHISPGSVLEYLRLCRLARQAKWAKAAILDRLLADVFISLVKRSKPDFSSLFLNGAAHVQHHYMFDSAAYHGDKRNPDWYSSARRNKIDPLLRIYQTYDRILGDMLRLKEHQVLITTGLSQVPNPRDHFQYRLLDAASTLHRVGLENFEVQMRMSRDFLVLFSDPEQAAQAQHKLQKIRCAGHPLFAVDNRGTTLFCQVAYHGAPAGLQVGGREHGLEGLEAEFVLVSIENGIHCSLGYHLDTGYNAGEAEALGTLPLDAIFAKVVNLALAQGGGEARAAFGAASSSIAGANIAYA